ncbi:MAG TPA: hypothetical protein VL754_13830 [Verrucomicrobiae bacterium]|jgi:hypothetical protein|nr:hypothetical protein [Verrucomicrobiae bacterium]
MAPMQRMVRVLTFIIAMGLFPALAAAQYTIVLKNGRRITTQAYREEGTSVRVFGLGGEFTIPRDEVQSILGAQEGPGRGLDLRDSGASGQTVPAGEMRAPGPTIDRPAAPAPESSELTPEEQRAKEEQEYRKRVEEVTERLKAAQNNFLNASRGSSSPDPAIMPPTEDAIRRRADDLNARLRDTEHSPGGQPDGGPVRLESPSPFTGTPPAITELSPGAAAPTVTPPPQGYTPGERQLSDLRNEMTQLTKEREQLIDEMKQKNLQTGNLFLDQ